MCLMQYRHHWLWSHTNACISVSSVPTSEVIGNILRSVNSKYAYTAVTLTNITQLLFLLWYVKKKKKKQNNSNNEVAFSLLYFPGTDNTEREHGNGGKQQCPSMAWGLLGAVSLWRAWGGAGGSGRGWFCGRELSSALVAQ